MMMTDYNDGKWHGWNGGECPVHPKTIGDITYSDGAVFNECKIGQYDWSSPLMFRVTKEHKDPRMFWAVGKCLHNTLSDAEAFCDTLERNHPGKGYGDKSRVVKLIEVLE